MERLRLLVLESTKGPTPTTSHAGELAKRLKYMEAKLLSVLEEVRPLVPGPSHGQLLSAPIAQASGYGSK